MANQNIEMKHLNGSGTYDTLYPKTLSTNTIISDATATEMGLSSGATVDQALSTLQSNSINLEQQIQPINMILAMDNLIANATSYPIVAQGTHGSSQRRTVTLSEECQMVIIQGGYDSHEWHICCVNGLSFSSGDGGWAMTSPTTVYLLTTANNETSYVVYKIC